jgi:hypothetical protein
MLNVTLMQQIKRRLLDLGQFAAFSLKNPAKKLIQIKANSIYKFFESSCF